MTMATGRMDAIDDMFDDHPSLSASLEDFEHNGSPELANQSPLFNIPSIHSGFRDDQSDLPESESGGPWSPPAWKRHSGIGQGGSGWYRQHSYLRHRPGSLSEGCSARVSRETSPQYESAQEGDITLPANVRLPTDSPLKRSPSPSPEPYPEQGPDFGRTFGEGNEVVSAQPVENPNNFIRFAVRAEVQHRTEPFEAAFSYIRQKINRLTKSRTSTLLTLLTTILSTFLLQALLALPAPLPVPDLVKVAGLAKAFEPLIFYSENGIQQIGDLQDTGVAVWDLGESVRSTNMTSAPIIVRELDELSESLKTLAIELTKFFANVDGDVDGILIVMSWARRELLALSQAPTGPISTMLTNTHTLLTSIGLLESFPDTPTATGAFLTSLFGLTRPQRVRRTLHRTFHEFLAVLEDAISAELSYSTALFALFEAIDRQFLNLARTVVRESDAQDRATDELLSTLWVRVLGPNASVLRKFDKNKSLLASIRSKTLRNKSLLLEHNGKLLALKANLEMLRKKLVSPLVRSNESATIGIDEQVKGLQGTEEYLRQARETQKGKLMERIYGLGSGKRPGREEVEGRMA